MGKRIAAAVLWFMVGLYGWAFIAAMTGLTPLFGPVLGATLAAFFAGDPLHVIWVRQPLTDKASNRLEPVHAEGLSALTDLG